jgi:hypothetical protein
MPTVLWIDTNDHTKAILTKDSDETLVLSVGDFITYEGRPDGVRVEGFTFTCKTLTIGSSLLVFFLTVVFFVFLTFISIFYYTSWNKSIVFILQKTKI